MFVCFDEINILLLPYLYVPFLSQEIFSHIQLKSLGSTVSSPSGLMRFGGVRATNGVWCILG